MQKPRRFVSFSCATESTDSVVTDNIHVGRPLLDTFVIPGRTRLPSSKVSRPDTVDLKIAEDLLNHSMTGNPVNALSRRNMSRSESAFELGNTSQAESSDNGIPRALPRFPSSRDILSTEQHLNRRSSSQNVIMAPNRRQGSHVLNTASQPALPMTSEENVYGEVFDGVGDPHDSDRESRFTKSTTSIRNHRVISDSSDSTYAFRALHFLGEYNTMANIYGLPSLTYSAKGDDNRVTTTEKTHSHGWIAKILHRSSSTFEMKTKTSYKQMVRKPSMISIPLFTEKTPKSVLYGKSFDEVCRLGGLSSFVLPLEFATNTLKIPTSLSATATYLYQHGRNTAGLFRIPGQSESINRLFVFFDHQYAHAGSPSKVEATVGTGVMPTTFEYSLPDVASLFKKIISALPGGLLGSLEIFETIRAVTLQFNEDSRFEESQAINLRAKMVALILSSILSADRSSLIQAVLGLASWFGFEADKVQRKQQHDVMSELMGYKSLGTVLGPLLLGDMAADINMGGDHDHKPAPRTSIESAKRMEPTKLFGKQKCSTIPGKLDRSQDFQAHVHRANLIVDVMQQLLLLWRPIVQQLKELNRPNSAVLLPQVSSIEPKNNTYDRSSAGQGSSKFPSTTAKDQSMALKGNLQPPYIMKQKIRISSRSPVGLRPIRVLEDNTSAETPATAVQDASTQTPRNARKFSSSSCSKEGYFSSKAAARPEVLPSTTFYNGFRPVKGRPGMYHDPETGTMTSFLPGKERRFYQLQNQFSESDKGKGPLSRQSSSLLSEKSTIKPVQTYRSLAECQVRSPANMSPAGTMDLNKADPAEPDRSTIPSDSRQANHLANLRGQSSDNDILNLNAIRTSSPDRESCIPRPTYNIGRGRRAESRSPVRIPSPAKPMVSDLSEQSATSDITHERSSSYSSSENDNADIIRENPSIVPITSATIQEQRLPAMAFNPNNRQSLPIQSLKGPYSPTLPPKIHGDLSIGHPLPSDLRGESLERSRSIIAALTRDNDKFRSTLKNIRAANSRGSAQYDIGEGGSDTEIAKMQEELHRWKARALVAEKELAELKQDKQTREAQL